MNSYPKSRQTNLVVQEFEKELLIYNLQINKAYCLNQTSAMVWQNCNGKNSIAEIVDLLSGELKTTVSPEFVWLALDQLKRDGLLDKSEELEIDFGGLNRRQVIKKVGLASMIALPLISSVIAPSALMAQSTTLMALNEPCASTSQCTPPLFCAASSNRCCAGIGAVPPGGLAVCNNGFCTFSDCCSFMISGAVSCQVPGLFDGQCVCA